MKYTALLLDKAVYWLIVLIPFSIAIAPAPMNVFMGLLIASFLAKRLLSRKELFVRSPALLPLAVFFAITCLSFIHSIDYRDTIKGGILRLLQYVLVLDILALEIKGKSHLQKVVFSMLCGLLLVSFDGIWQVATGKDFIRGYAPVLNIGLVRATASFKDSNLMGIYLSGFIPVILGLTLFHYRGRVRILLAAATAVMLTAAALTFSRPTLLALFVVFFFFAIAFRHRLTIALLVLSMLAAPFFMPAPVKDWAKSVDYNLLRFMCNDDRIAVYRNSLNMIRAHPLIGLGANTYMKNYRQYKETHEYRGIVTLDYMYAHNNFIHMAAEVGLVGLGAFIWFLWRLFAYGFRLYRKAGKGYIKVLALSLCAAMLAFLVNGLTESSLYYSRIAVVFWYLAGLLLALSNSFASAEMTDG